VTPARRHIAIIAPPTAGHINPLVALGAALASTGSKVTVVHMAEAASLVSSSTVRFAAVDHPADREGALAKHMSTLAKPSGLIGLPRMIRSTATMTRLLLETLPSALTRLGIDAVIADSVEPAGALVARHLRLPFVTAITGLPLLREVTVPPPFLGWPYRPDAIGINRNKGGYAVSDLLLRPINATVLAYARRWGLDPNPAFQWSDRLQIAQCPARLDFPRTALPPSFQYGSPWRQSEPAESLPVDDDRPLIFCSLGSLQGARRALFAAMTSACAAVGARAVVAHGGGLSESEAASLPGDPLVRAFLPQTQIMHQCSAAILHCGFNTVLDALAAGIPIVAVPIAFEQPATAARLVHVGAACVVSPADAGRGGLEPALRHVLAKPGYRRAARHLAKDIAAGGGATEAAALIIDALLDQADLPPTRQGRGEMDKAYAA
jgi:MGT family glycosyltransferase